MSFAEIGLLLGISPKTAYKIYKRALKKLSTPQNIKKWERIMDNIELLENMRRESDSNTLDFKEVLSLGDTNPKCCE